MQRNGQRAIHRWLHSWLCFLATLALAGTTVAAAQGAQSTGKVTVTVKQETIDGHQEGVLTTPKGMTLYFSTLDTPSTAKCTGRCARTWKPLTIPRGKPTGPAEIGSDLGTVVAPGGGIQVEYKGHPLYTYSKDHKPGDRKGAATPPFKVAVVAIKSAEEALGTSGNSSAEGGIGSMGGGR